MPKKVIGILLILLFALPIFGDSNVAFAKVGDLYDDNKDTFDEHIGDGDFLDTIKDYDFANNYFDCGWFGFNCKLNGVVYKMILGTVKASFSDVDETAVVKAYDIINNALFEDYKEPLSKLSTWMLAIFLMWHIMKAVAMRYAEMEDGMISLNEKVVKVIALSILLALYNPLFEMIMNFQQYAVEDVLKDGIDIEQIAVSVFIRGGTHGLMVAMIVALVTFVFSIAFMYRFVLFGLLYIVGVIAIPTGLNDEYNYFSLWLRLLISNGVTLFLQALTFTLGVNAFFQVDNPADTSSLITGLAFFVLALSIPSLLGQLGASTGTGRAVGSVIRVASRGRIR